MNKNDWKNKVIYICARLYRFLSKNIRTVVVGTIVVVLGLFTFACLENERLDNKTIVTYVTVDTASKLSNDSTFINNTIEYDEQQLVAEAMGRIRVQSEEYEREKAEQEALQEAADQEEALRMQEEAQRIADEAKAQMEAEAEAEAIAMGATNETIMVTRDAAGASDYEILCRIVEAEVTGGDLESKMIVANVVLNRVGSTKFPNTIEGVVFESSGGKYQFSPIYDGRYYSVNISDTTKEAVDRVLAGEDNSEGALFFLNPNKGDATWFNNNLTYLFDYGGHSYYK